MNGRIIKRWDFSGHAVRQMFTRRVSIDEVKIVATTGEVIADYPEDKPYPSQLLLATVGGRPIHVVLSYNSATETGHIVTAYVPDPALWEPDFKTRRRP